MKANFVCFKLSKMIIGLILVILIQLIFITIGIKEIIETKSFEQMKENINIMSNEMKQTQKQKITTNKSENTINQNLTKNYYMEENIEEQMTKNQTILKEELTKEITKKEYETMPREVKGFKVIRKNYYTKIKSRYIHFRRNKQKIIKSISYKTIWTKYK